MAKYDIIFKRIVEQEKKKKEIEQEAWRTINEFLDSERSRYRKEIAEIQEKIEKQQKEIETLKKLLNQQNKK